MLRYYADGSKYEPHFGLENEPYVSNDSLSVVYSYSNCVAGEFVPHCQTPNCGRQPMTIEMKHNAFGMLVKKEAVVL